MILHINFSREEIYFICFTYMTVVIFIVQNFKNKCSLNYVLLFFLFLYLVVKYVPRTFPSNMYPEYWQVITIQRQVITVQRKVITVQFQFHLCIW